tara:strand:- start:443 stop:877 length:435 start_codon:yes stop_codon:yes gene_type:complete
MVENDDKEILKKALENEENEKLLKLTSAKIMAQKNNILQKMQIKGQILKSYHKKLKDYRLIEDIDDITYGNYIRWFNIKEPDNIKLTNGAHICDIKICDTGTIITCKNRYNQIFSLILDECIVFQKLNREELILLSVIDYLEKK